VLHIQSKLTTGGIILVASSWLAGMGASAISRIHLASCWHHAWPHWSGPESGAHILRVTQHHCIMRQRQPGA
jgi:hypothetical protein